MAKKKVNKRRTYDLSSRDVIVYDKSSIPRQIQFMILRGTGLLAKQIEAENEEIKIFAKKRRFKVKFMKANTLDEIIFHLNDANTWASGVVYQLGNLTDKTPALQKKLDRLLIPTLAITPTSEQTNVMEGIEFLING